MNHKAKVEENVYTISRVFDAPRTLVWQAWSDCEHLKHWWGPKGWELTHCDLDFRPGGFWHYCMAGPGPDGSEMESWGRTVYREIVEPERIVSVDGFSDREGNVNEDMPEMLVTATFEEVDGKTKVVSQTHFSSAADLETGLSMGMEEGVKQTWDRLEEHLTSAQQ